MKSCRVIVIAGSVLIMASIGLADKESPPRGAIPQAPAVNEVSSAAMVSRTDEQIDWQVRQTLGLAKTG